MSEDLEFEHSLFPERQLQLAPVEVIERVRTDERRIISAEYTGIMAQETVEEAMYAEFRARVDRIVGDELSRRDLDYIAASGGLTPEFTSVRDLGLAWVKRRVELVAGREGLDLAIAARQGLRAALIKKHTEEVERERA